MISIIIDIFLEPDTKLVKKLQPQVIIIDTCLQYQWPLLLTWFNFNPSMDK